MDDGIDEGEAKSIVESRRNVGPFSSTDELVTRKLIPTSTYEKIRSYVVVGRAVAVAAPVSKIQILFDARGKVQESSLRIGALIRQREATKEGSPEREDIDRQIAAIQRKRSEALIEVVLADNPEAQVVDRARGIYRVPIKDSGGRVQWVYGSVSVIWHLQRLSPSIFSVGASIRSNPPAGSGVTSRLLVGGSAVQTTVQPYPGDVDFAEEFDIAAPDAGKAGASMAETVAEFVSRASTDSHLEFVKMVIMLQEQRPETWSRERILDRRNTGKLGEQFASVAGGKINTYWRALVEGGRYVEVTKVLSVRAVSNETRRQLFATQKTGAEFQEAYLDAAPPEIEPSKLAEYAALMRDLALAAAHKGNYLKAAKRAFNYFRAIGDLEAMAAVSPVFSTDAARINQQAAVLEAISLALNPDASTRILTVDNAQALLKTAADEIESFNPTSQGRRIKRPSMPPRYIAHQLRALAASLKGKGGDPRSVLAPSKFAKARLDDLLEKQIKPTINISLEKRVKQIIEDYLP
jgi:hypothetical protein